MSSANFDKGLKIRREVLGSEYVDASIKNADDFTQDLQEFVTATCWGEIWGRPGLDRKTRSFLNLAMLTALNRPHEVKLHVRGAMKSRKSFYKPPFIVVCLPPWIASKLLKRYLKKWASKGNLNNRNLHIGELSHENLFFILANTPSDLKIFID